jgi:hypothetical protein
MERKYDQNSRVVYVDPKGEHHAALVTRWWVFPNEIPTYRSETGEPGCNVVYVTSDITKVDQYGLQLERSTSVVHKSKQPAPGNYWMWPDEV